MANAVNWDYVISIFTDGSKTENGTGSGIYSDDLDISLSLRLPNSCTVFQTEIYDINVAAMQIREFLFCA